MFRSCLLWFWLAMEVQASGFTFPPLTPPPVAPPAGAGTGAALPPTQGIFNPLTSATADIKIAASKISELGTPINNLTGKVGTLSNFFTTQMPSIASQAFALVDKTTSNDNIVRICFIAGASLMAGGITVYVLYRIVMQTCRKPEPAPDWQIAHHMEKMWEKYDGLRDQKSPLLNALQLDILDNSAQYVAYLNLPRARRLALFHRRQEVDPEKGDLAQTLSRTVKKDFLKFLEEVRRDAGHVDAIEVVKSEL